MRGRRAILCALGALMAWGPAAAFAQLLPSPALAQPAPPLTHAAPPPSPVVGVDVVADHEVPEARVLAEARGLVGAPLDRAAVRRTVERLWALGLFAGLRVESVPAAGGVRLRYVVERAPWIAAVRVDGDLGVDIAEVMTALALPLGGDAGPAVLARARRDLLALYEREGYLGAQVELAERLDPRTRGASVAVTVAAGPAARVGRVHVSGAERVDAELVRKALGLRPGRRYRAAALREGVEAVEARHRARGFLTARVTATRGPWQAASALVDLDVVVHEGPHVTVTFEGASGLGEGRLRERLTFADSGIVDADEVAASARQLEAAYREAGFAFAEVTGALEGDERDRHVRFRVREGPRVRVASVDFPGLRAIPPDRLRERMETRVRGALWRPSYFSREALDHDVFALTAFLRAEGYPDARVGPAAVTFEAAGADAHVRVPVDAGPRLTVGAVSLAGARAVSPDEIRAALPLGPGHAWSQARQDDGERAIERRYAEHGYGGTRVTVTSVRHDDTVDVLYTIIEGEPARIGRVLVDGLALTREDVVRRILAEGLPFTPPGEVRRPLRVAPGEPLRVGDLAEAYRQLTGTGLFDLVEVEPLRPPPRPFADVSVRVRERKPWHVDFGAEYRSDEGPRGFVEVGHDNLFGTARSLSLRETAGERGYRTELTYREPWVFDSRWQGDASLFYEYRREIGYEFERVGLSLGVRRDLLPERVAGLRGYLLYQLSRVDRFNVDPTLAEADVVPGVETIGTGTATVELDRRDRPLDPRRGRFHALSLRLGSQAFGGDSDFVKARGETQVFLDWWPPTVLALSARVGLAGPLAGTAALPAEERFYAGGSNTVRGYRENRLGPLDARGNPTGGNGLLLLNAEWRFPLWRQLGGAVFVDSGLVAATVGDIALGDVKTGVGAGLRLSTPVGPVRLDVGYPLDRVPNQEQKLRVYFSVGQPF